MLAARPASRRTRDAERTRTQVLDAAEVLFAERGFPATSMAEIGAQAGVSRGTPGYFFRTKDLLYRTVMERSFADALETVRAGRLRALRSGRPRAEVLEGAVSDYVDFVAAHPLFIRLIQREALGTDDAFGDLPLGRAVGGEAVAALAQELGFPSRAKAEVQHLLLSLVALTWFPQLHADTLVRSIGLDPAGPRFLATRKRHITSLLLGALPAQPKPSPRRSRR